MKAWTKICEGDKGLASSQSPNALWVMDDTQPCGEASQTLQGEGGERLLGLRNSKGDLLTRDTAWCSVNTACLRKLVPLPLLFQACGFWLMARPRANKEPERRAPSPFVECVLTHRHNGNKKSAVKKSHWCPVSSCSPFGKFPHSPAAWVA